MTLLKSNIDAGRMTTVMLLIKLFNFCFNYFWILAVVKNSNNFKIIEIKSIEKRCVLADNAFIETGKCL